MARRGSPARTRPGALARGDPRRARRLRAAGPGHGPGRPVGWTPGRDGRPAGLGRGPRRHLSRPDPPHDHGRCLRRGGRDPARRPGAWPGLDRGRGAGPGGRDLSGAERGRGHRRHRRPATPRLQHPGDRPARHGPTLVAAAAAAAGWRGLGDPAAGTRVASRAAGPGAAQCRRGLPDPGQDAPRGRHAGVPRSPPGRRQRPQPGLGRPCITPGPGQRPGSGADPHRRAALADPPAHRGGRHPGAGGGPGPAGAHRHD